MASNNRGLEVYMSVEGIDKLIQAIKSLQSEMQNITMDMASLQKNVSGTRGWIGNGKEECAQVLLLLTKGASSFGNSKGGIFHDRRKQAGGGKSLLYGK